LKIKVLTSDNSLDRDVLITAWNGQQEIARIQGRSGTELKLPIPNARLWSPEDPFLYDLKVRLGDDEVSSYFAMRKVALGKDENGFTSILLNNKPVFQAGPLDQGYWPDGIFTAPTDEALRWDLSEMKRLGFNMVRKHIKVEPERWFYWCDKLGLLVWQDMPSGGGGGGGDREKEGKIGNPEVAKQFEAELREMIDQFENHPSIIMWVIFNEAWGQYDTQRLTNEVKSLDPSRIINSSSGWADVGCGDINDWHVYPGPACPEPEAKRAVALGEFGGIGLSIPDHTWTGSAWGYRSVSGVRSLTRRYVDLWRDVWKLKAKNGLCAAIYTQWTDIETEGNGLYTYDRKILKVDPQQVADAHRGHFNPPTTFEIVIPTSKDQPALWRYTTEQPATSWYEQSFNDKSWREAEAGFGMKDFSHATARTLWDSEEIWLRRDFVLPQGKLNHPALHVLHGQEVEIYLNGVLAVRKSGRNSEYEEFDISEAAIQTLKPGLNQISIHAQRGKNSNFIDVGLVQERK
jgi:hypothetical protein